MSLGTPIAVLLAILFLIPGFIWKKIADVASPYARPGKVHLLECLTLSCINYLLASVPIWLLLRFWPAGIDIGKPATLTRHWLYVGAWLFLIFALPVLGGWGSAKLSKMRGVKRFFRRFGISILHPASTAWDYAFARDKSYWARIELNDGSHVEGLFDSDSLASTEPGDRDIFLAVVCEWNEEKQAYEEFARSEGILVRGEHIKTVTFLDIEEDQSNALDRSDELEGICKK